MNRIESNVYLIENLGELDCNYWLYKVRGLSPDLDDYQKNVQLLVRKLSKITKSTCAQITIGNALFIAQPEGEKPLPDTVDLVRTPAKLEREPDLKRLRFDQLDDNTAILAQRFLYGSIQAKFFNTTSLWQPATGHPFYDKYPDSIFREFSDEIDLYRGFTFRVMIMPNREIGICIDVRSKYVSRCPLPTKIITQEIGKFKGVNCLYEYGNKWYEIKIQGLNDLNASELNLPNGKTLFEEVHSKAENNKSPLLRDLPENCSVLFYYDSDGEPRNVPSGLCRRTYQTNHPLIKKFHKTTVKAPHLRLRDIEYVVNKHFRNLSFNGQKLTLSRPISYSEANFSIPDLRFGNNKILSTRNTPGTLTSDINRFPFMKKYLLYSQDAGIFVKEMFDKQFIIMPKSILDTFGGHIVNDVKLEVNKIFLGNSEIKYEPIVIPYNDSVPKSIARVGNEILKAVDDFKIDYGYGVVMIPTLPSKRMTKEDELANLVMKEMRKRDLYVSIIHTKTSSESFEYHEDNGGDAEWRLIPDNRIISQYKGYIQNVVLNKILLLNEFWPFVLATPLNADLIIGIDVKKSTAGFTTVHKTGEILSFTHSESEQKEQLGKDQLRNIIQRIITGEQKRAKVPIKSVVIHRQGTIFNPEKKGIEEALRILSKQGIIDKEYECSFVEVRTTSRIPFRMFRVSERLGRQEDWIENPIVGTYKTISSDEAFICNTGPPFTYRGTTHPLHILKEGPMSIEKVLQDVFYLACLTWTKIDDCLRLPISIKMGDIRLREIAGEYDAYALRFEEDEEIEEA
jgi:hypothetical protein